MVEYRYGKPDRTQLEAALSEEGNGSDFYAAGTDRFVITTEYNAYDPLTSTQIDPVDWRGVEGGDVGTPGPSGDPYVTQIGSIFDLPNLAATGELKFLTAGVFDVSVHVVSGLAVDCELSLLLDNEAADGSDEFHFAEATRGPFLGYVWAHMVDDVIKMKIRAIPENPGPLTTRLVCQVVKLSNVAPPADEFDEAYSGDLSELLAP